MKIKFVDGFFYEEKTLSILRELFENVEVSDDPDFVFCSVGYKAERFNYECARVFITGENIVPDFNSVDYAIGFNNIEFGDRYKRIPLFKFYTDDYQLALDKHINYDEGALSTKKFCNFIYSNGSNVMPERDNFFELLSRYKTVDSGGRHLNNIGYFVGDKLAFQSQYKFSIAFENASSIGYTTEKILQAFSAGTVPIYYGNPEIAKDFNPKSFVNCHDFSSFGEVVERVKELDLDIEQYSEIMRQPIFNDLEKNRDPIVEYREYLYYICSQNKNDAIRRCNDGWSKTIQNQMKDYFKYNRTVENGGIRSFLIKALL